MSSEYSWSADNILAFIHKRSKYKLAFSTGENYVVIYQQIIDELGLADKVTVEVAANLWENLVNKYKELSQPSLEPEDAAPPSWPFFHAMQNAFLTDSVMEIQEEIPTVSAATLHSQEVQLSVQNSEETVEEEAARLEEVFRSGNIVSIQELQEDSGDVDDSEDQVILEDLLSSDEECDDDDDDDYIEEDMSEADNSQREQSLTDSIWTHEKLEEFIAMRGMKHTDMIHLGQTPVYLQILTDLQLSDRVPPAKARKKWAALVQKYYDMQKLELSGVNSQISEDPKVKMTVDEQKNQMWPFYKAMKTVMENIIKDSSSGPKCRRSPEYSWTVDITRKFIRLRTEKHAEISIKGHNAVYQDILNKLGIGHLVSVTMARKKWNYLVKRYQDEELAGGLRTWAFMKDMKQVMKHFRGANASKLKSRASPEFLWPNELTRKFIELRSARHSDFIEGNIQSTYMEIMEELGLEHILNPNQLRKKWNYLIAKYKELSCTTGPDGSVPAPHTWPFYEDMEKAMQMIPEHLISSTKIVRVNYENIWTSEALLKFIQLRGSKSDYVNKKVSSVFAEILDELGLTGQVTPYQARKKWNYLYTKYMDLCHPEVDEFARQSWPYFPHMQKSVGSLPVSQVLAKRSVGEEADPDDDDKHRKVHKKARQYICFICRKSGNVLNDFFMFEQNQHLLHTQKTVVEIISYLVNKKLINMDSTTYLCSQCTNLVNEADSAIYRHNKVKEQTYELYLCGLEQAKLEREQHTVETPERLDTVPVSPQFILPGEIEDDHEGGGGDNENNVIVEEKITYSKRGRKRKVTVMADVMKTAIKSEPLEDGFEGVDCDLDFDDDSEEERKRKRVRGRWRGRGRVKRRRGRPTTRTTLIGRGLGGQYPSTNKRKLLPFKGPKIYHCTECKSEFKKYTELISHKKDIHTVVDKSTLEVHETVLENGVITYFNKGKANNSDTCHQCKECEKRFLRKDDLWYHQEISHTEGKGRAKTAFKDRSYDCQECGEKFLFKYKLKMHINSKHLNDAGQTANDFTCGQCGCKLGSLPGLTFHMRKHHNKSLTYRKNIEYLCSDCGFMASTSKKLKEHQEAHCGASSKPKVQCEICGKTVLKVSLKMHKAKMHSEFKEQCDRCGERYATKTDLLRHINVVHLKIYLYTCATCGERFATSDALRYHRVKFHEKPSFYCQGCGKCYKRVGELNTHIKRAHNDRKKAEVCQYCGKEYYDRSGLRNHLVNKHNVPQEMTYSENYLRKKRVDGLPLAKHIEKRIGLDSKGMSHVHPSSILQQQLEGIPQETIQQQQQQVDHQPQQQQQQHSHVVLPNVVVSQHQHLRVGVLDEAAEAARNLNAYHHEMAATAAEEESALVVTEITESPQVEQAVLVDPLTVSQGIMHHPQVAHMQPPMTMHHHMHHPMQHHANMRLNVLYQMNMHHPGSHINM